MSEADLRALPDVGPAIAKKLIRLGIEQPANLEVSACTHDST
jgi:hypothetical protein